MSGYFQLPSTHTSPAWTINFPVQYLQAWETCSH